MRSEKGVPEGHARTRQLHGVYCWMVGRVDRVAGICTYWLTSSRLWSTQKGETGGKWCGKKHRRRPCLKPALNRLSALSSLHSLLSSPTMSSSAIYAVSPPSPSLLPFSDISHFLYTAQEPPANRPARPRAFPTTFTCSSLRVSRYHQIRVRCPFTRHSSPPHSAG